MKRKILICSITAIIIISIGIGGVTYIRKERFRNYICEVNTLISEQKYDEAQQKLVLAKKIKNNDEISNKEKEINLKKEQNQIYNQGLELMNNKKYIEAINKLSEVDDKAEEIKEVAESKIKVCKNELLKKTTTSVDNFISQNKFDDAYKIIETVKVVEKENDNILKLKEKVDIAKNSYEEEQKRIAAEEEAKRIEEEKKNSQGVDLETAKEIVVNLFTEQSGFTGNPEKKLKEANSKLMFYKFDISEKIFDNREGYFIPIGENHPTYTVRLYNFFVDKKSGEIFQVDSALMHLKKYEKGKM